MTEIECLERYFLTLMVDRIARTVLEIWGRAVGVVVYIQPPLSPQPFQQKKESLMQIDTLVPPGNDKKLKEAFAYTVYLF